MAEKKETLTIICQNLNRRLGESNKDIYTKEYPADIYAFQEFHVKNYITVFVTKKEDKYDWENDSERAKELWDDAFPWTEFRSGYWAEKDIRFADKEIKIINVHCSPTYSVELRYILLKRLSEVKYKYVILLGDFNASFEDNDERSDFLNCIECLGFKECLSDGEDKTPVYTYAYEYKGKTTEKKYDHIFVSGKLDKLKKDKKWGFTIVPIKREHITKYLEEKKINVEGNERWPYGVDHDGIKLTIEVPHPKE